MIKTNLHNLKKGGKSVAGIIMQNKVEEYLKANKIKKKDFAAEIGVSNVMFSHWLHGRVLFNKATIDNMCKIIGLNSLS